MAERRNVVLIVIGGARADHLSCYGHSRRTSPALDEVANDGVRVANVVAAAGTAVPAHAALFTGRYSAEHGAHEESRQLARSGWTIAEILRSAGYRTVAFCPNPFLAPEAGFGRGFETFSTQRRQSRIADRAWSYGRRAGDRLLGRRDAGARRTNDAVKEWLGTQSRQPFFAFIDYDEARLPFAPLTLTEKDFAGAADAMRLRSLNPNLDSYVAGAATLGPEDAEAVTRIYDSALHYVDARIAEVVETLQHHGHWDDTLLVIAGDHGQLLGESGWLGNSAGLSDALLRVPLILRCPGLVPQGFVVEELSQTVDVAPTVLGLTIGSEACRNMSGRVLLRDGRATSSPGFAIAERYRPDLSRWRRPFPEFDVDRINVRTKIIRTKNEKFVWRSDEDNELYDLRSDPTEQHNHLASNVARADELRRQLFDWFATIEQRRSGDGVAGTRADVLESASPGLV